MKMAIAELEYQVRQHRNEADKKSFIIEDCQIKMRDAERERTEHQNVIGEFEEAITKLKAAAPL